MNSPSKFKGGLILQFWLQYQSHLSIRCNSFDAVFKRKRLVRSMIFCINVGIPVFRSGNFFRFTLKAFISIRMTVGFISNDYFYYVRHVSDIFGTIRPLKIIFWDYIFENFRLKMNKNAFFGILWLYKGNYYLFKLRNEEFRCLRSEYMTIIIS